ncbi:MAG TPA: sialidase family protein, partial [Ktedonobacterales bacterium]
MPNRITRRTAAIVVVIGMLLASGCGSPARSSQAAKATATPTGIVQATATAAVTATLTPAPFPPVTVVQVSGPPVPGAIPTWRHTSLPAGFGRDFHVSDLQVEAGDGMTAYACTVPTSASHPQVIVTHDRGMSWTRVADVPASWYYCGSMAVDVLDPAIAIVREDLGPSLADAITTDGGATWR